MDAPVVEGGHKSCDWLGRNNPQLTKSTTRKINRQLTNAPVVTLCLPSYCYRVIHWLPGNKRATHSRIHHHSHPPWLNVKCTVTASIQLYAWHSLLHASFSWAQCVSNWEDQLWSFLKPWALWTWCLTDEWFVVIMYERRSNETSNSQCIPWTW